MQRKTKNQHRSQSKSGCFVPKALPQSPFLKGTAADCNSRSYSFFYFFSVTTMYIQLKKLMVSKYSSSLLCDGYISVSNLNTKVWGFCFFFFLFPFTVCVALRMFLWTNRAVFPEWSQMRQRCQSLRVPQPWENHIYGNGKSIKHLSYCFLCSVVFMFKKWFCLLRMKKM